MSKRKISVGDKCYIPGYACQWVVIEGGGEESTALVFSTNINPRRSMYVLVSDLVPIVDALDRWLGYDH